jgi:N-acetylmuramoyl-L-alanine amidase
MRLSAAALCILLIAGLCRAIPIKIDVVYPRPDMSGAPPKFSRIDSTFVFGSVNPADCKVRVNGVYARVYENGAFIAYAPVDKTVKQFKVLAYNNSDSASVIIPYDIKDIVESPQPFKNLPMMVEITDPNAVIRYSDNLGIYYMFPAKYALCQAVELKDNFLKIRLNDAESVWIETKFVTPHPDVEIPSVKRIYSLEIADFGREARMTIPGGNRPLHRTIEDDNPSRVSLILYGMESHIDFIRNLSGIVREVRWEQLDKETLKLTFYPESSLLWGYKAVIDSASGNMRFSIYRTPEMKMKELKVAIDPGHGGDDYGSVGPTRLLEKDINLTLALKIKEQLEDKDVEVFLTRSRDENVKIYDRMDAADKWGADLFISIHNNALPDGANPFNRSGAGVYYYQPKSLKLAESIHTNLLKHTKSVDDGLFYGNLAVPRTTYMPAALIEAAFIMLPEDEMKLRQEKFQKNIAKGVCEGIEEFIEGLSDELEEEEK